MQLVGSDEQRAAAAAAVAVVRERTDSDEATSSAIWSQLAGAALPVYGVAVCRQLAALASDASLRPAVIAAAQRLAAQVHISLSFLSLI
jgi:hypothetical protein